MAVGALSPEQVSREIGAWLDRFQVPVFHEPDGSVSVGRADGVVEAIRQLQVQARLWLSYHPVSIHPPRTGSLRRGGDETEFLITVHNPEPATPARPDIRLFKTFTTKEDP